MSVGAVPGDAPVRVFTEWDPLEEVIVGEARGFNQEGLDASFHFMYRNWLGDFERYLPDTRYEMAEQVVAERAEDLDGLAALLQSRGIVVRRPNALERQWPIRAPHVDTVMNASDAPRDMFLAIGSAIIETPPTNTKRLFEAWLYRDVLMDYFRRGATWIAAPRPTFVPGSLDFRFHETRRMDPLDGLSGIDSRHDIAFDAANCLRFGRDLLFNVGTSNHELGAVWLARTLGALGTGVRVHPVRLTDSHIDWQLMPLRPGTLLVHERFLRHTRHLLPNALQHWEQIPMPDPDRPVAVPPGHAQMASVQGMDMNVLSLNPVDVLVREESVRTAEVLARHGFNPIPVRLRHCELFGDGLHCATLDVRRTGDCADVFR
ncbi:MAG: hypothetical protein MUF09_08675 [Candidatus Nanopelagicales bacterium]|nr:hypothetical protein [Candidatus Nanopelagicales bacterium]